jgi:hypothetical protein
MGTVLGLVLGAFLPVVFGVLVALRFLAPLRVLAALSFLAALDCLTVFVRFRTVLEKISALDTDKLHVRSSH